MQDGVPLHERAAARVLPGEPDRHALLEQRAERDSSPIPQSMPPSRTIAARRCTSCCSLGCSGEALGHVHERVADVLHVLGRDGRLGAAGGRLLVGLLRGRPLEAAVALGVGAGEVAGGSGVGGLALAGLLGLGEHPLQLLLVVPQRVLGLLDADVAAADERLGVELADRALGLDQVVHQRLGHRRVVALVVTAAAVADQVDDDVLVERLAELVGQLGHPDAGLGVVAVDVEDRRLDHPGDVGAVDRGARRRRRGREADLVVDDHVDRAAGAVAAQLARGSASRPRRPGRRRPRRRA